MFNPIVARPEDMWQDLVDIQLPEFEAAQEYCLLLASTHVSTACCPAIIWGVGGVIINWVLNWTNYKYFRFKRRSEAGDTTACDLLLVSKHFYDLEMCLELDRINYTWPEQ